MSAMNNERNPTIVPYVLGTQGSAIIRPFIFVSRKFRISAVRIVDAAGIALDAVNFVTVRVRRGSVTVAEYATATDGAVVADVSRAFRILDPVIPGDTHLNIQVVIGGTGTTTNAFLQVEGFFV